MKICFVINRLIQLGPVVVMKDIIAGLQRSEWDVYVLSLRPEDPSLSIQDQFEAMGCKCFSLECSMFTLELRTKHVSEMLEKFVVENGIDLIHTHTYHPDLAASYLPKGKIPVVTTLHNLCGEDYCFVKGRIMGSYMSFRHLGRLRKLTDFVSITNCVAKYYKRKAGIDSHVIYNGVDVDKYIYRKNRISEVRKELHIADNAKVFIYCGNLMPRKNPKSILISFLELLSEGSLSDIDRLLFVGKGPMEDELKSIVPEKYLKQVIFAGFQKNVADYYFASNIGVSASLSEGFGLNVVEAVACGLPFVASDIPPHREILSPYEPLQELLFSPGSDKALKESLLRAYKDCESYDMESISRDICDRFSSRKMSCSYQEIYKKLISACKRG